MQEMIQDMQAALEMVGGSVGFTALFLAGIVTLWYNKMDHKQEHNYLFWYGLVSLLWGISPFYRWLMERFFPELLVGEIFLWILPVMPVLLYMGVEAFGLVRNKKERVFLCMGIVVLLLLAGASSYTGKPVRMVNDNGYVPLQEQEIIEITMDYVPEGEEILLWGDAGVMEYVRMMTGDIHLLYGKDLWLGNLEPQMHQIYEDWHYIAYEQMQHAPFYLDEITKTALERGCDALVFSKELFVAANAEPPTQLGDAYYMAAQSQAYLLYLRMEEDVVPQ